MIPFLYLKAYPRETMECHTAGAHLRAHLKHDRVPLDHDPKSYFASGPEILHNV